MPDETPRDRDAAGDGARDGGEGARDERVTVVVLTYERAHEVCRTLSELAELPERPEVIVVDNGSRGPTVARLSELFPQVHVLPLSHNVGAAARNVGLLHARTRYVAFCDDDTWWQPGALAHGADLLDAHPEVAVLTGRVLIGPEQREDPACAEMAASPLVAPCALPGPRTLGYLAGASMVRRDAFLAVGGYERRFFLGGEEALVAIDLAAAGWQLAYVPELVVHHHPSSLRDARARRRLLRRNALWVAWLRRPVRHALRATAALVAGAVRDPSLARGLAEAVVGLPWALRHRRRIPGNLEQELRLIDGR
ncbi:MAG: glycosyltransferase [Burkholderiaceae bacterium]